MTFRAATYDAVDPGIYDAVLEGIEEGENDFGDFRKWRFTAQTPVGEHAITAMTSGASGPKSKAYKWAAVLLGHKPTGDEERLAGLPCQLHLIVNDDGFNRVEALLPAKPQQEESSVNLERIDAQVYGKQVEVTF